MSKEVIEAVVSKLIQVVGKRVKLLTFDSYLD